jgi:eukaryotic-like serine/threonine-protein kinase
VAGTPPVVPPEAFGRNPLDQRADLYSLGALAYWMLTGRHAYPARRLEELPTCWRSPPPPPSAIAPEIPKELDHLVLRLLDADPLGRPASAAEVIGRLTGIGELAAEGTTETRRLALSFLSNPRFIGRTEILARVRGLAEAAFAGHGGAVLIEGVAGMGRSRLLEEIGRRAQLAGALVVRVDAGMGRQPGSTTRALAVRTADAAPELARKHAAPFRASLGALGPDLRMRLGGPLPGESTEVAAVDRRLAGPGGLGGLGGLDEWFAAISSDKPLVVQVDNVDSADDDSLGMLAGLAKLAPERALLIVATECTRHEPSQAIGMVALRECATRIKLAGLDGVETLELCRYLFDDAPGVERFAEWLSERTVGSPLHALEISRQMLAMGVVRYADGVRTRSRRRRCPRPSAMPWASAWRSSASRPGSSRSA